VSEWILVVLLGITGWGVSMQREIEYGSEGACYKALDSIQSNKKPEGGQWLAYCMPNTKGEG
jgi:hypothetical protein